VKIDESIGVVNEEKSNEIAVIISNSKYNNTKYIKILQSNSPADTNKNKKKMTVMETRATNKVYANPRNFPIMKFVLETGLLKIL
jgi:hypothetical protein